MSRPDDDYTAILQRLASESRLRSIPDDCPAGCVDLTSNDYLGLGSRGTEFDRELAERFPDATFTSSASRLLSRRQKHHRMLEDKLSDLYGRKALLFNSGYHANVGITSALAIPDTLFVCDKAIHASVIDGLAVGKAEFRRFPHNDMRRLEDVLSRHAADFRRVIITVESVYSMDGDVAPLRQLVEIKKRHPNAMVYLDEAHAVGVRGARGLGLAEECGLTGDIDIIVGTFGKALASSGAFAVASDTVVDYLINAARPLIFSTALPPVCVARSLLMLEKSISMTEERKCLASLSRRLRLGIESLTGTPCASRSQIVPLITGDAAEAVRLAETLRTRGFDSLPIRRPTVAAGTERIRFSLNAGISMREIDSLLDTLIALKQK